MKGKGKQQLEELLCKAESYTRFVVDNRKRTNSIINFQNQKRPRSNSNSTDAFKQPPNLVGGTLYSFQIDGLQWLLSLWENGLNGILADEMGLGKTIEVIALIAHLRFNNTPGPYLITAPLATICNWIEEFTRWLPSCPVVMYHGSKAEREDIQSRLRVADKKSLDFPVVITNYEMCLTDKHFLEQFTWQYIIVDEGHRIKNHSSALMRDLKSLKSVSRLLLTGTPIQNSLEELWSLLNFCSPMIFDDLEVFKSWFGFNNIGRDTKVEDIISEEEQQRIVTKLHEILRPFVLRRLKKDVLPELITPKRDVVVYCSMSSLQRKYYAMVLDGTLRDSLVSVGVEKARAISLINVNMNLRKVCNHPFLFGDLKDGNGASIQQSNKPLLVAASGKLKLLDRMLPRLKAEGHRVLLYSQMTKMLDILEDYLILSNHSYVRFDGSSSLEDRQTAIDQFNHSTAEEVFLFLLSTRAGGLGINLTTADTVILFDSDWNPHQDSQAQARCHRIGQQQPVVSYRLLTTGSVEIDMMERQISKKKLERLTMVGGGFAALAHRRDGTEEAASSGSDSNIAQKSLGATVSVDSLRALLADDVGTLARREQPPQKKEEGSCGGGGLVENDISDRELDRIMDRSLLFPHIKDSPSKQVRSGDKRKRRQNETADIRTADTRTADRQSATDEEAVGSGQSPVSTSATAPELQVSVPLEGAMYDIVLPSETRGNLLDEVAADAE